MCRKLWLHRILCIAFLMGYLSRPLILWADVLTWSPSLQLREEYTDNFFYDNGNETEEMITTLTPGLNLERRTDRLRTDITGQADVIRYRDHNAYDTTDFQCDAEIDFGLTERTNISSSAGYARNSRKDRNIETTGLVLDITRQDRYFYDLSWGYAFSEKSFLNVGYNFMKEEWESQDTQDDSQDLKMHSISTAFQHQLDDILKNSSVTMNIGAVQYEYPSTIIQSYNADIGLNHDFSETMGAECNIGLRSTNYEYSFETFEDEFSDWSGVGHVLFFKKGDRTKSSIDVSHDMEDAGDRSRTRQKTSVSGGVTRQFTQKIFIRMNVGYIISHADEVEDKLPEIDEATLNINPALTYRFTEKVGLMFAYGYLNTKNNITKSVLERNRCYFQLTLSDSYDF